MRPLTQNTRYAVRMLMRSPGFTAAALLCIALGTGATTAIFSVVHAVVMRPLEYREPGRLVRLYSEFPTFPGGGLKKFWISAPEFLELRQETKSWEALNGWFVGGANLAGAAEPVRVTASFITAEMFDMLGRSPLRGRLLTAADDRPGADYAVVISYGLWQRAFGGDSNIIGRDTKVNGRPAKIVGVMPRGFQFPPGETDPPEIWIPQQINPAQPGGRGSHFLSVIGRLRPGASLAVARQEIQQLVNEKGAKATQGGPHSFHPKFHYLSSYPLHEEVIGNVKQAMMMMLGAVGFVLLIACMNVANLLLARSEARQREIAIRRAIGAGTGKLVRQFLAEGVLMSMLGSAVGLLLAYGGLRLILMTNPGNIPRVAEIGIDTRVLLFSVGIAVLTGVFFGLAPLAQLAARSLNDSLKSAAGRATATIEANRLRRAMVVLELGLALVLLIGTGLMVRAFWKLQAVEVGLRPERVLTMRLALPQPNYPDAKAVRRFWVDLQQRVRSLPGVESASMMTGMPPMRPLNANDTQIEGFVRREGGPIQNVDFYQGVGDRYFETMGIRLIDGRLFDERDSDGGPLSVIVNQTMARTFWPEQGALGRRLRPGSQGEWRTVVGVVADVKNAGIDKPTGAELYFPIRQTDGGNRAGYLMVRTAGDPRSIFGAARAEVAALDPSLPVASVRTMEEVLESAQARPRFLTLLLTLFSTVALSLAAVGIYGVMAYSVEQRTSEFGVRMAIGAQRGDVLGMVLRQGILLGLIGAAAGAAGAFGLTRLMRGLLFGVETFDPLTFAVMALLLVAVTTAACFVPARRATKVDPVIALRYE